MSDRLYVVSPGGKDPETNQYEIMGIFLGTVLYPSGFVGIVFADHDEDGKIYCFGVDYCAVVGSEEIGGVRRG